MINVKERDILDESELDGSVKCVRYIGEERASRKTKKKNCEKKEEI